MLGCQLDDLNQVEVSFKANPGHIRINVKKIWTHLEHAKELMVFDGFDGSLHDPLPGHLKPPPCVQVPEEPKHNLVTYILNSI